MLAGLSLAQMCAYEQQRLRCCPEREMISLFSKCQTSITNFKHVSVAVTPELNVIECERVAIDDGFDDSLSR
jgi:hypothetical protein